MNKFSKWKYPVYNGEYYKGMEVFGYAKDAKHDKQRAYNLNHGTDYVYDWEPKINMFALLCLLVILSPLILLGCFKLWPLALSIAIVVGLAFLARFSRRLSKKFRQHASDKEMHKS